MCGICGILCFDKERKVDQNILEKMNNVMVHRGPDDEGYYLNGNVGFGHRRLSIIDIAGGHQPMTNEDGSIWIIFNGEIYNYQDLRQTLIAKGHVFKASSDTEVIIHAYEEYGESVCEHLRGIFAFAIWDSVKRHLYVARDRMGVKPFYYYVDNNVFVFSSEIKSMLRSDLIDSGLSYDAIDSYLSAGFVPGKKTMFKNILKLEPSHYLKITDSAFHKIRYWNMNRINVDNTKDQEEWTRITLSKLKESVNIRLMSDVPLGVFLSGGIDSSLIVAMMRELGCENIKTFSVGYQDAPESNELNYARLVSDIFKTEHHEFILEPMDFLESIKTLVKYSEEPIVERPAIALYHLSKQAKEFVTVILSGEGADEVFAGYTIYSRILKLDALYCFLNFLKLTRFKDILVGGLKKEKYKKYAEWALSSFTDRYKGISNDLATSTKMHFYGSALVENSNSYLDSFYEEVFSECLEYDSLSKLLYVDTKGWLVDDLLLKADKMTMANSIELRVPFLDHELIELAYQIPSSLKMKRGITKYIVKQMAEGILPKEIIWRKKMGFTLPSARWFRGKGLAAKIADELLSGSLVKHHILKKDYIERIIKLHQSNYEDYSRRLFSFLVLEEWVAQYT